MPGGDTGYHSGRYGIVGDLVYHYESTCSLVLFIKIERDLLCQVDLYPGYIVEFEAFGLYLLPVVDIPLEHNGAHYRIYLFGVEFDNILPAL